MKPRGPRVFGLKMQAKKLLALIEGLMAHGDNLPEMSLEDFAKLFGSLMRGKVVRPRYGTDPRLAILGPLEARMLSYDKVILGGLNEGIWPAPPSIEPFLSRGMRKTLGLSCPSGALVSPPMTLQNSPPILMLF